MRTFGERHGEDVTLEVALEDAPRALVDDERSLARKPCVEVRLRHDPRRGVRDALNNTISWSAAVPLRLRARIKARRLTRYRTLPDVTRLCRPFMTSSMEVS